MKKINIILIIFISILLFPFNVDALSEGETKKLYLNFNILEDGSMKVYEVAELLPSYNGRIRTLSFKNINASEFTGKKEDFEGSSIYNADSISNIKISDIDINKVNPKNLNNLELGNTYTRTYIDSVGESNLFMQNETEDGYYFKIFNPSTTSRAFYMEYTYDNVAVVHNDVAELAWNILGDSYDDNIEELIAYINLPKEDKSMRVWLRGPLDGNIKRVDDKTAKITYKNLERNNAISFRIMFNKSLVPYSTKHSNIDGKANILETEKKAADIANKQRERARLIQNTIRFITIGWYITIIVLIVLVFKKKKELEQCEFNQDYLRDFPADYSPGVVEYLIDKKITDKSLSAAILNLINKKVITVDSVESDKNDYIFKQDEKTKENITESEKYVLEMLFSIIGDKNGVTLKRIKNYSDPHNTTSFFNTYNNFINSIKTEANKEDFFRNPPTINVITLVVSILGCIITVMNISYETDFLLGFIAFIPSIVTVIIVMMQKYRSKKGVLHYKKWMALKHFMEDFGTMDEKELPEIIVWEKYLVYATVLGCADKLERDMRTRFENMNITEDMYPDFYVYGYYNRMYLYSSLHTGISHGIHNSYSNAVSNRVASSSNSSGSGFGGGASFGGGSFGGGGGGGHF